MVETIVAIKEASGRLTLENRSLALRLTQDRELAEQSLRYAAWRFRISALEMVGRGDGTILDDFARQNQIFIDALIGSMEAILGIACLQAVLEAHGRALAVSAGIDPDDEAARQLLNLRLVLAVTKRMGRYRHQGWSPESLAQLFYHVLANDRSNLQGAGVD